MIKLKILLINISLRPESPTLLPPLGLAYIATAIYNAGYELEILDIDAHRYSDDEVESMIREKDYDVAAMGCIVTGYKQVKKLCSMIKKYKNVPIIVGNSVASSVPELLLEKTEADIAVIGEGDITDIEVLKYLNRTQGGAGKDSIAKFLRMKPQTFLNEVEPYLIHEELIEIASRRKLTEKGKEFLRKI